MTDPFAYDADADALRAAGRLVVAVPAGLADREALFDALADGLALPSWFGRNWDALDECLHDLSWLAPASVALVHADLPALPPDALAVYLEVLRDAALAGREAGGRELVVAFPRAARRRVRRLLREA